MTPLAREIVLVVVVELMFVREFTESPCKCPLQSKVKITLKKFNGTQLSQDWALPLFKNVVHGAVPTVEPFETKLKSEQNYCHLHDNHYFLIEYCLEIYPLFSSKYSQV